ncbi:MAG: hypothetical protein AAFY35_16750 [Pseudomonadota bacterium]
MQTSILLPLILISGTGSDTRSADRSVTTENAALQEMLAGCRSPVLDTTEASRILYDAQLGNTQLGGASPDAPKPPLFIARCGDEFVLFTRRAVGSEDQVLYARFQDRTYDLIEARRG